MNKIVLQISPEARSAYFGDYVKVARSELLRVIGDVDTRYFNVGPLEFFELDNARLDLTQLAQLSFVQGIYEIEGKLLRPLDISATFNLHDDFVFGSKFKGKTNERLTQLLINVGLAAIGADSGGGIKLLDPMCGRATTLLWAMRYGINARGIEQDSTALVDIHRNLKKWTKLHRQKHKLTNGFIGPANKKQQGKFLDFNAEGSNMRVVIGDARKADQIFTKDKFDLIVSDLPYGVQHLTDEGMRSPLNLIEQCVVPWKHCLKKNAAIVLAYNRNNPKRGALVEVFEQAGFDLLPLDAGHRMSESILRDVVVFKVARP